MIPSVDEFTLKPFFCPKIDLFQPCSTCGDYHFKRICSGKDLKVNLIVRQINQKAEVIKENMDEAWSKLHALEQTYNHMLMKTYRLQSNHICLQMLAGQEDGHPDRVSLILETFFLLCTLKKCN